MDLYSFGYAHADRPAADGGIVDVVEADDLDGAEELARAWARERGESRVSIYAHDEDGERIERGVYVTTIDTDA